MSANAGRSEQKKRRIPNVPAMKDRIQSRATRPYHVHGRRNAAGSKLVRKFFKAKNGIKATSAAQALAWYASWKPIAPKAKGQS